MVLKWMEQYRTASRQTKLFIWNCILYGILILGTTAYCYGRLDFVRSYKIEPQPAQPSQEHVSKAS